MTAPTTPLLNTTVLLPGVVLKPVPVIVIEAAFALRLAVLFVTETGTVATWTAEPLLIPLVVTTAVRLPAAGFVENVTVNDVAVAEVTVPIAPLLKVTRLLEAVVLKPVPAMVIVDAALDKLLLSLVTVGVTRATWIGVPLLIPSVVTTAVKLPAVGFVEKVTVSEVAVAAVTLPTAPLLKTTVLFPGVVLKPAPVIVTVAAVEEIELVTRVTAGLTVAICTAEPLLFELVVTTAVKFPSDVGLVLNVIVKAVGVAVVTVPTAPLLKTTVLFAAVELNPNPLITTPFALMAKPVVRLVTTGVTVATCTAEPLVTPPEVTIAVRLPAEVGRTENVTVSEVVVAAVTVPTAPLLNTTVLFAAVALKPVPAIVTVDALAARLAVELVTVGVSVATCTGEPLLTPLVVTMAVNLPAVGTVENEIDKLVAVADVTVPTAPLLKTTVLSPAVVLKPVPLIVIVVAPSAKLEAFCVTTGRITATCTGLPLLCELVVTVAVRFPATVGLVLKVTVRLVVVAEVTVPTAPLLKVTVLFPATALKPNPVITIVFAVTA